MHADPSCATLLIKAWSDCHRRASITNPPFFHPPALTPRPAPNPSSSFLSLKSSTIPPSASPRRSSAATFRFPASAIRSLLADLHPTSTPFDALASLFCLAISRANSTSLSSSLTLVTDFRKRMEAPLPFGFYGNAAHFSSVQLDLAAGRASVADSIGRHVAGLEEEEYWSAIEWLAEQRAGGAGAFQMYGPELTCVKLDHVMAYAAEMEEGVAPAHVSCWIGGAEGNGVITVLPAAPANGEEARTVEVVLPAEVAEKVVKDKEILLHGPTVIFSGRI